MKLLKYLYYFLLFLGLISVPRWEPIAVPEYDVDTAAALDYLFGQVFSSAAGHFVLDYFSSKIDNLGGNLRFEVPTTLTIDGKDVARIYDGFLEKAGSAIKYELKNWSGWYPSTIKAQFIRDIQGIGKLDELKWVFNSTAGVNSGNLKPKLLETLKKVDGSAVDELEDIVNNRDFQTKLKKWLNVKEDVSGKEFIDWLDKNENFDKIFEIVE